MRSCFVSVSLISFPDPELLQGHKGGSALVTATWGLVAGAESQAETGPSGCLRQNGVTWSSLLFLV